MAWGKTLQNKLKPVSFLDLVKISVRGEAELGSHFDPIKYKILSLKMLNHASSGTFKN